MQAVWSCKHQLQNCLSLIVTAVVPLISCSRRRTPTVDPVYTGTMVWAVWWCFVCNINQVCVLLYVCVFISRSLVCQWRAVSSTPPVENVWDQETLTVAGVCCIMCKCLICLLFSAYSTFSLYPDTALNCNIWLWWMELCKFCQLYF